MTARPTTNTSEAVSTAARTSRSVGVEPLVIGAPIGGCVVTGQSWAAPRDPQPPLRYRGRAFAARR
jgi:hypothetical protein